MNDSTLDLDYLIESYIDNEVIPKSEAMRDRFGSYWLHRQDLGNSSIIRFGRIVDYVPYANAYKVQADQQSIIWCTTLTDTGLQPFGAKSINTLPVGAGVFYLWYRESHWGYIIGVVPDFITNKEKGQSDYISPGSRAGILADAAHRNLMSLQFNGGVVNWSAGRPVDSTGVGEWGAITETGLMFFLDPYMACMKVNEETGIWGFFYDQLLRIAGHNLQFRTAMRDQYEFDDQDEPSMVSGITPYTWERLGLWSWGNTSGHRVNSPLKTQVSNTELARIEPAYSDQQPFMRKLEFEGYLGQGGSRLISLPPCPVPESDLDLNRFSIDRSFPGAFEEHIALTGAYSIRSAKEIIISKRWGVTPKQKVLPEDDNGDNETNYKSGGMLGDGDAHLIKGELSLHEDEDLQENILRRLSSADSEVWVFNWKNLHQFHYHKRDWYLPEHSELPCTLGISSSICESLAELSTNQYMSAPTPVEVYVDHRYGNTKYWLNESVFILTEDGGVSLIDGYGVEWRSTGGNLDIFAPADINLHAGRSFNLIAGKDINLRANNSIDIISNNKDVRIKAEHNFMALSGNDGCGGTLLENRAICPAYDFCPNVGEDVVHSGIFLKSFSSRVAVQAADVVIEANCNPHYDGQLVLDTNDSRLRVRTGFLERFVSSAILDFFINDNNEVVNGNEWWQNQTVIGSPVSIHGCMHVYGIHSKGNVVVIDGHIGTSEAATNNYTVAQVTNVSTIDGQFTSLDSELAQLVSVTGPQEFDFAAYTALKNIHNSVEYSLRTNEQYGTNGYVLAESRWQQTARLCEAGARWVENPVATSCSTHEFMYPWPGPAVWCSDSGYKIYNPKFKNPASGSVVDRDTVDGDSTTTIYEDAVLAKSDSLKPDGNYVIPVI